MFNNPKNMHTMKNTILTVGLFAAALLSAACGDESIETYNPAYDAVRFTGIGGGADPDALMFDPETQTSYYNYSFLETPFEKSYEFDIPVYLIGMPAAEDRTFGWEIIAERTTAPAGCFRVISAVIPAGETRGALRVAIDNADELAETSYTAAFKLVENEVLRVERGNYLRTQLTWNNSIPFPPHNNIRRSYNMLVAGEKSYISTSAAQISANGLRAIVAATGWNDWDDKTRHPIHNASETYGYYKYLPRYNALVLNDLYKAYALMLRDYLEAYKAEHGGEPLLHDSGAQAGQPIQARTY